MKKYILFIILILINIGCLHTQTTNFTFFAGASLPNNEVTQIFQNNSIGTTDSIVSFLTPIYEHPNIGYNLSIKGSIKLSESTYFYGNIGFHKFKINNVKLTKNLSSEYSDEVGSFDVFTTLVPLSAGINYFAYQSSSLNFYFLGGLDYNFIIHSLENIESQYTLKVSQNISNSYLGLTLGIGTDIPLGKSSFVLEGIYSLLDYINNEKGSTMKNIYSIRAGLKF